ncbi:alpha/beta hydrolase family protein [Microlunatus soli]|uniref:alpha/beta hydrolase family protein n=1 Tax=Microlunatus soli TaxID=630515 RepID=UPI0012F83FB1|nr:alpha/beta hydrolase [Microlunatus soli]
MRTLLWRPKQDRWRSLVVLSHGSGGAAANLGWLAEALCDEGFLVAAVDHHGNSSDEELLPEGAAFWWERPADLTVVVDHVQMTEKVGSAAVAGYSLGGYTAAAVLGARVDAAKLRRLYDGEPVLPIPPDRPDIVTENAELVARYGRAAVDARAVGDYRDRRFVAGVLLAQAICPILSDASLSAIDRPVLVRWGGADEVEAPEVNGQRYTRLIPGADGRSMGQHVGHFEFGDIPDGAAVRSEVLADVLPFFRALLAD